MGAYRIVTDSVCDIPKELLEQWGVVCASVTYMFDGEDTVYQDLGTDYAAFYGALRAGKNAKTSAINIAGYGELFRGILEKGEDVLFIGFSSGLSSSYNNAVLAARDLEEDFPERKILCVDSLSASGGYGLLVALTVKQRELGVSLEEAARFAEATKLNICHWFTVDNLDALARGGRMKTALAAVGSALGIKPVLHTDNEGHLTPVSLARGRKGSLRALVDRYGALALTPGEGPIFISQADCREDADYIASLLQKDYGAQVELVTYIGAAIGIHTGPGTISLFFVGKER